MSLIDANNVNMKCAMYVIYAKPNLSKDNGPLVTVLKKEGIAPFVPSKGIT